jgi:16S rRNA U1498 N3-methylase RsmE
MVLWPLALGKEYQLTVKEFLHLHQVHRNSKGSRVYNIQTRRGKLITLETKYSSNHGWNSKYFFTSGQWEFAPME